MVVLRSAHDGHQSVTRQDGLALGAVIDFNFEMGLPSTNDQPVFGIDDVQGEAKELKIGSRYRRECPNGYVWIRFVHYGSGGWQD